MQLWRRLCALPRSVRKQRSVGIMPALYLATKPAQNAGIVALCVALWRILEIDCLFPPNVILCKHQEVESVQILKSSEDYLEAMLMAKEQHGYIRSIDIALMLGVTKPSVSYATKRLRENGYITMDKDGLITLTPKGMEIAERIYRRHKALTHLLMQLGVPEKTAREDACRIEHDISEETFRAICAHAEGGQR